MMSFGMSLLIFIGIYLSAGVAFVKLMQHILQNNEMFYDYTDPVVVKIIIWIILLVIWPSCLIDVGGGLLEKLKNIFKS